MLSDTIHHAWNLGPEAMRVECPAGHVETLAIADEVAPCDALADGEECGLARGIIARGPHEYDPRSSKQRREVKAAVAALGGDPK